MGLPHSFPVRRPVYLVPKGSTVTLECRAFGGLQMPHPPSRPLHAGCFVPKGGTHSTESRGCGAVTVAADGRSLACTATLSNEVYIVTLIPPDGQTASFFELIRLWLCFCAD